LKLLRNIRPLVLVSTLLSVISSAQTQPPLFPTTSFVDLGAQKVMATGDCNGDGQTDLVTIPALNGPLIVSVLLNADSPTPPLIVTSNLGSNISVNRLLAVDMNNDKKLDLVANASNGSGSGIAVLFGNGDGTFQSPVFYPVVGSGNLVATDLNGDGYPDLAIVTAPLLTSLKIAVLLNQGSNAPGILSAPTFYPLSITFPQSGPLNIGAGDFNGDGKQDILVGSTSLAVFYGVGDGTLQSQQSPVVPIGLSGGGYFVASDLNHDGISDVAYIATSTSTATQLSLQVLLGHSNGTFTVGSNLPLNLSIAFPIALIPAGTTNNGTNVIQNLLKLCRRQLPFTHGQISLSPHIHRMQRPTEVTCRPNFIRSSSLQLFNSLSRITMIERELRSKHRQINEPHHRILRKTPREVICNSLSLRRLSRQRHRIRSAILHLAIL